MIPTLIAAAVIALDQLTKVLIRANLELGDKIPVIGDWVRITYLKNTGAAFSSFENNYWITIGLTTVLLLVCLLFMAKEWRRGSKVIAILVTMVFAGGLSNLLDRVVLGYVTDMISVGSFAIFNVADMAVTCGCVLTALAILLQSRAEAAAEESLTTEETGDDYE